MRDQSLFLIKNSLGAKMKKGLRNFCTDDGSTSTLNQQHKTGCTSSPTGPSDHHTTTDSSSNPAVPVIRSPTNYDYYLQQNSNIASSNYINSSDQDHEHYQKSPPPTLEEMILRLDLEEEIARSSKYSKLKDYNKYKYYKGRMSCVNNSDILRSARKALNQYPRFSLDGKDAMYQSSFRNSLDVHNDINVVGRPTASAAAGGDGGGGRKAVRCSNYDFAGLIRSGKVDDENDRADTSAYTTTLQCSLPTTLAGVNVVWCKPGVVAKLMGLEAMPVPLPVALVSTSSKLDNTGKDQKLGCIGVANMKRQNFMIKRRAHERHQMERRLVNNYVDIDAKGTQCDHRFINQKAAAGKRTITASSSCTTSKATSAGYINNNYWVMKPGVANS